MIASQGDTWDMISYNFYGSEYYVTDLMLANPQYSDIVVFEGGEQLVIPTIVESNSTAPWRD